MMEPAPLRLLFVTSAPWTRNLGASRVYLELAEALTSEGHDIEKFSWEDAFPAPRQSASRSQAGPFRAAGSAALSSVRSFGSRARRYIRAARDRFDVIDAGHTDLAFSKRSLETSSVLVARSVAFVPAYAEFERFERSRWAQSWTLRRMIQFALFYPRKRRNQRTWPGAFRFSDLINVSSRDDERWVRERLGFGHKVAYFPFGLSSGRAAELSRHQAGVEERLRARTVAFIGTWNARKGRRDWPIIARRIIDELPDVRFRLLGTDMSPEVVLRDFPPELRGSVEVVPRFESDALPRLLERVTVGAFPGYLESFGFGVLELFAAGLPTVLYDSPGPRDIASHQRQSTMVPRGDVDRFARQTIDLLKAEPERYGECSRDAVQVAGCFRWEMIARQTAESYADLRARLRSRSS